MKSALYLLFAFLITTSLSIAEVTAQGNNNEQHIEIVDSFLSDFIGGNIDEMAAYLSDSFTAAGPGADTELDKNSYIENWNEIWENQLVDMNYTRIAVLTHTVPEGELAGDWVLDWIEVEATYQMQPDAPVTIPVHTVYSIADGKISFLAAYYDVGSIWQALNYTIEPPSTD